MTLDEVRTVLEAHREELAAMGVRSLRLFGSVARGEAGPDSDVDLLVELGRSMSLFDFAEIKARLQDLLGCRVDLVMPDALQPPVRSRVLEEAVVAT